MIERPLNSDGPSEAQRTGVARRKGVRTGAQRAFSMLELMIVIAILALLIALVTVVASRVRVMSENAATTQFMVSLKTGLTQFKDEHGYYPPLIDDDLTIPDDPEDLGYYSTLSLVPYLIGRGDLNRDGIEGADDDYDDGCGGVGFRDPGPDRSWGGASDAEDRLTYWHDIAASQEDGVLRGRIFGPYIELADDDAIGVAEDPRSGLEPVEGAYQLNDVWQKPVRYYRFWPADSGISAVDWTLPDEWFAAIKPDRRSSVVTVLRSAPYVLLSPGHDLLVDEDNALPPTRQDNVNKDNLLQIGD